ncbi:MAG TPA: aminoglycoside phosphotransferase family protein [Ktedonobacteraceae bacterium]|nr:aminoglycoside phosphotransferase family protein [Ktedonobacteraceae bacterium]
MREPPNISEDRLQACLQDEYNLSIVRLEFLPRGLDFKAGVYRVVSEEGVPYLLKVTSRPLYEPGFFVPRYLKDQGITSVVAPIPTNNKTLWTKIEDWTLIVYPFIDGDTSWTGMTNEQWKEVGKIFKWIHNVRLKPEGFSSLRKETFDPTEYVQWIRDFESQHLHVREGESENERALRDSWVENQATIHTAVTFLEKLSALLQPQTFQYVICHADLHPANLIRDDTNVFVIDWDEVMLAPKERDFIFIREPQADAFWEGYGKREINWLLLSYYLWERVVQDVIVNAQDVCFREDLGEETKAEIAQLFRDYMEDGGNEVAAAYEASARLAM